MRWKIGILIMLLGFVDLNAQQNSMALPAKNPTYEFVANRGQWHPLVLYRAEIPFGNLYLESQGLTYDLIDPEDYHQIHQWKHDHPGLENKIIPKKQAIKMYFMGVENAPHTKSSNIQSHYYNYFFGENPQNWASKIHPAGEVKYSNVYSDVDFRIDGQTSLKYEWIIQRPTLEKINQIKINIEGADSLKIIDEQLNIYTSVGIISDEKPYTYQLINGEEIKIASSYHLNGNILGYQILSDFNPDYPLIIDPKLIFSTYSGSKGDNFGYTATYDSRGNLYAGGIVDASIQPYPVTTNSYDTNFNGGTGSQPANLACDISISKYDSSGSKLLWATYLGGSRDEYPHSLVVDKNNDLIILGTTYSPKFPHTTNCVDSTHAGGTDIIVSKLSEDGTALIGSTFIGGTSNDGLNQNSNLKYNYSDDFRGDVITDNLGNIFVATTTLSQNIDTKNASQTIKDNAYDGLIFELSPDCKTLNWLTYFGGDGSEALYSIKLDNHDNVYVGGGTTSPDLQTPDTVFSPDFNGKTDGVIAVFDKSDKSLKRTTYWGTSEYDQIYFIGLDASNRIYATGQTEGKLNKTPDTYGENNKGQFIFRIDSGLQNIDLVSSFGNTLNQPNLVPSAFLVDVCNHIYFSGWGSSVDPNNHPGSTNNMPVSDDAYQKNTDNNDFYIIVLGEDAKNLLYATYFGGDVTGDHVDGGTSRFDKKGVIYQSVCSSCPPSTDGQITQVSDFPTTAGSAFETNPSVRCSNASFKIDLQIKTAVIADFIANPMIGCAPLNVSFTNRSILGDSLIWDFGDGEKSNETNPKHEYNIPGEYTITLTVIDSNTCNISSISQQTIRVVDQSDADFSVEFNGCDNQLSITNNTIRGYNYYWSFGNGDTSIQQIPSYQYPSSGTFEIELTVNKGSLCESSIKKSITILDEVIPEFKLYNVFTPNGDGLNDCFQMDGKLIECKEYKLQIFNRWGEKVFETDDPYDCWNGGENNNTTLLPEGTYFYLVWHGKNSDPISGIVELIK